MASKPENLVVFVENLEKLDFFSRLREALTERGHVLVMCAARLSVIRTARRLGFECIPCRRALVDADVSDCLEVLSGDLDERQGRQRYGSVAQALRTIADSHHLTGALIWNGGRVADKAVADHCAEQGLTCLYFEIGNIPGKMIADPAGVNARSLLAGNGFADRVEASDGFEQWRASFIEDKLAQRSVPQAASIGRINVHYLTDLLGFVAYGLARSNNRSVPALLRSALSTRRVSLTCSTTTPAENYYFLPLQVTNDTQLFLNSSVDNKGALEHAVGRCREDGKKLVVKPHPAEKSARFLAWLDEYARHQEIHLCSHNTMALIRNSDLVITINSTVGLEALLCGRPIEVLGQAVYKHFREQDLDAYVNRYLLDIDYFSHAPIAEESVGEILSRLRTGSIACVNTQQG